MNKSEKIKAVMTENGGIARTSDLVYYGLTKYDICEACNRGDIIRIKRGHYLLSDHESISEEKILSVILPEGTVTMLSALYYYGYSDYTPRKWDIAVPRSISRSKIRTDILPMQIYYTDEKIFELGKISFITDGVELFIYDRERVICDCFKYRSRMDSEVFGKALKAYVNDRNKDLSRLAEYAKALRVYAKLADIMGVILNG